MEKVYIVTDLGPGDGGKGSVVHALADRYDAAVIIKRGGAQGSHGVRNSRGESFNFSQWGCGTLEGIPTFCSEQLVLMPVGLHNEARALQEEVGVADPFAMLQVDPNCLCATPYHQITSEIEELRLGNKPRGTVGSGVGCAYREAHNLAFYRNYAIHAFELRYPKIIRPKLMRQRQWLQKLYNNQQFDQILPADRQLLEKNLDLLNDDGFLAYCVDLFAEVGEELNFCYLPEILEHKGIAIVECSHGVLTDAECGLKPHVSAIRTLPKFTEQMLGRADYTGEVVHLAVHRAYEIRHGAGPMPTYDADFTAKMLPDSHKSDNRWQGKVRAGALDFNLMRYALEAAHETKFAGICLTWFDQITAQGSEWKICNSYQTPPAPGTDYTQYCFNAQPQIFTYHPLKYREFDYVKDVISQHLGLPLAMLSFGPTERDKTFNPDILPNP